MLHTRRTLARLERLGDIVALGPQIVGRFYDDGNRLGQRAPGARPPRYYKPERWIGSSTLAANPPGIPAAGQSHCPELGRVTLKDLVAHPEIGPRLLGEDRFRAHGGTFRVLIKLLDAKFPIPLHVHADDRFVTRHRRVYPNETFGKDEAYHFLEAPKGDCPFTHIGLHKDVTARDVIRAMRRGTDHVLELSPPTEQRYGEGYFVRAGLLHRPGTALTLEIQQPSDVYTMFQTDFGGKPMPTAVMHPGFSSLEQATAVVNWKDNTAPKLVQRSRLRPRRVAGAAQKGGVVEWVFPPEATSKFSGVRLTVTGRLTYRADDPYVLYVWRGRGTAANHPLQGGGGPVGQNDEYFVGVEAARRGVEFVNTGDEPLVAFALFAAALKP